MQAVLAELHARAHITTDLREHGDRPGQGLNICIGSLQVNTHLSKHECLHK